jgi:hypothetical protein
MTARWMPAMVLALTVLAAVAVMALAWREGAPAAWQALDCHTCHV